jgi:hypothetical protein
MQKFKLLLSENIMVFSPADVEDKFPTTIWWSSSQKTGEVPQPSFSGASCSEQEERPGFTDFSLSLRLIKWLMCDQTWKGHKPAGQVRCYPLPVVWFGGSWQGQIPLCSHLSP